ncbi:MAG: gliding motility protein GldL [Bacteroidetes bacterium]|nr:gliding motility protein GldL [Bacteroidota bacterium]MCL6102612.1 gliding motility protein GldL [Bacteroidota bacterium]
MGLSELTHSHKWKTTMSYFYSIGASVVLLGALFKLEHWTGGGTMLMIGMSCEALIFFLSAFEPLVETPDWAKVYPQLSPDFEFEEEIELPVKTTSKGGGFDDFLEKAEITPELLSKLKKGIQDLTNTAKGISEISSATLATELYVKNLGSASQSMSSFSEVNNKATLSVERSLGDLVHSYEHSSKLISGSSKELAESFADSTKKINQQLASTSEKLTVSYKEFTESIHKDIAAINENSKNYSGEISRINTSMSSLNSSYELHLQNVKKLTETSAKSVADQAGLQQIVNETLEEAKKYHQLTERMNKNLEALNQVYGNMLGAMNIKG